MSYGGGGNKCDKCTKAVYAAEPHISADGKSWHTACFKCSQCKSQLALTTWAQLNGENMCKVCFKKIFSLRGSYNDVAAATPHAVHSAATPHAVHSATSVPVVMATVPVSSSSAAVVVVATPAPATEVEAELMAKPAQAARVHAPAPAPAPTPTPVAAPVVVDKSVTSATTKSVERVAPSQAKTSVGFGGGNKCSVCAKAVYAADPQFASDGKLFHKNCFKCLVCKSQLGLSSLAQIEGFCLCKTCYKTEFKMRGKYDDVIKTLQDLALAAGHAYYVPKPATTERVPVPVPVPAPAPVSKASEATVVKPSANAKTAAAAAKTVAAGVTAGEEAAMAAETETKATAVAELAANKVKEDVEIATATSSAASAVTLQLEKNSPEMEVVSTSTAAKAKMNAPLEEEEGEVTPGAQEAS